jgi:lipopolysaccharide export system protein LptA
VIVVRVSALIPSPGTGWGDASGTGRIGAFLLCLTLLVALVPGPISGAEPSGVNPFPVNKESLAGQFEKDSWDTDAPVDIQSRKMSVDFQKHEIIFRGDVKVRQADFSLTAREVTAVFGESAEDIRRIVAKGDVTIQKADKVAWGNEAVYDRPEAVIVLRGDPRLRQGKNFIRGEEISVFLNQDRMDIKGGVSAEFRLKEKPEGDGPAGPAATP